MCPLTSYFTHSPVNLQLRLVTCKSQSCSKGCLLYLQEGASAAAAEARGNSMYMDYFMSSLHDSSKRRRWEEKGGSTADKYDRMGKITTSAAVVPLLPHPSISTTSSRKFLRFSTVDDEMACGVVPPVTIVLEGRSICQRIHLHKHESYQSFAAALRHMFVDIEGEGDDRELDLSNAIPGYVVAYEDLEDDLLLAGDLSWKDFVRVVKRIRILPAKPNHGKNSGRQRLDH